MLLKTSINIRCYIIYQMSYFTNNVCYKILKMKRYTRKKMKNTNIFYHSEMNTINILWYVLSLFFFPYGYVAVAVGAISISLRSVSVSSRRFPTAGVCFSVLEGFFLRTTESHSAHERLNTPQEHPITHD